jgi:multidrug transporter EmrE-like cation transporter
VFLALYVSLYAVLNTLGLLLLRTALRDRANGRTLTTLLTQPRLLFGLALYALGFVTWVASLRRYELSTVYPVFVGVGYVSVVGASVVVLSEHMTAARVVGIALVGAGVVLLVR